VTLRGNVSTLEGNIVTLRGNVSTLEGNIVTLRGNVSTLEGNIVTLRGNVTTLQSNITNLQGQINTKQANINYDSTPIINSGNLITSGNLFSVFANKANTNANSTYTALQTFSSPAQFSKIYETITPLSISAGTLTCNYASANAIVYCSPSSTNFTFALTNVPTNNSLGTYTVSILANLTAGKGYCNVVSVNGTNYTPVSNGGFTNLSVNASATFYLQQISVLFFGGANPNLVTTNLISMW
jgi:hypothetical protein